LDPGTGLARGVPERPEYRTGVLRISPSCLAQGRHGVEQALKLEQDAVPAYGETILLYRLLDCGAIK
jgi:hypothetical protein